MCHMVEKDVNCALISKEYFRLMLNTWFMKNVQIVPLIFVTWFKVNSQSASNNYFIEKRKLHSLCNTINFKNNIR
jgi:hypothetical protein